MIHEYAHFKMVSFCRNNRINYLVIPTWLNEGISEYISFQFSRDKADNLYFALIYNYYFLTEGIPDSQGVPV